MVDPPVSVDDIQAEPVIPEEQAAPDAPADQTGQISIPLIRHGPVHT